MTNPRRRVFHYFAISMLSVATIYYFIIASNLGGAAVPVEFRGGNILNRTRQVFYARWVGYFINFALIWFALLLMSGVGWASILFTVGLSMLWATMFLIGMFVRSSYKWGFFVMAIILWALIIWQVMGIARSYANTVDSTTHRTFTLLALWELFFMSAPHPPPHPHPTILTTPGCSTRSLGPSAKAATASPTTQNKSSTPSSMS
jgi:bacteriorhodopsin